DKHEGGSILGPPVGCEGSSRDTDMVTELVQGSYRMEPRSIMVFEEIHRIDRQTYSKKDGLMADDYTLTNNPGTFSMSSSHGVLITASNIGLAAFEKRRRENEKRRKNGQEPIPLSQQEVEVIFSEDAFLKNMDVPTRDRFLELAVIIAVESLDE